VILGLCEYDRYGVQMGSLGIGYRRFGMGLLNGFVLGLWGVEEFV
jgi:hypothetical protein